MDIENDVTNTQSQNTDEPKNKNTSTDGLSALQTYLDTFNKELYDSATGSGEENDVESESEALPVVPAQNSAEVSTLKSRGKCQTVAKIAPKLLKSGGKGPSFVNSTNTGSSHVTNIRVPAQSNPIAPTASATFSMPQPLYLALGDKKLQNQGATIKNQAPNFAPVPLRAGNTILLPIIQIQAVLPDGTTETRLAAAATSLNILAPPTNQNPSNFILNMQNNDIQANNQVLPDSQQQLKTPQPIVFLLNNVNTIAQPQLLTLNYNNNSNNHVTSNVIQPIVGTANVNVNNLSNQSDNTAVGTLPKGTNKSAANKKSSSTSASEEPKDGRLSPTSIAVNLLKEKIMNAHYNKMNKAPKLPKFPPYVPPKLPKQPEKVNPEMPKKPGKPKIQRPVEISKISGPPKNPKLNAKTSASPFSREEGTVEIAKISDPPKSRKLAAVNSASSFSREEGTVEIAKISDPPKSRKLAPANSTPPLSREEGTVEIAKKTGPPKSRNLAAGASNSPFSPEEGAVEIAKISGPSKSRKLAAGTSNSPFRCEFCDYTNPKRYLMQRHMKSHSEDRPFQCTTCDRRFKTPNSLQNHVNTHTGHRPHHCTMCEASFTTSGELVRHVRYKHTLEKPHKCPHCDYASVELSKLKRHMRSHSGERPYQCPNCMYASPDTYKLKRHMRVHTGEKPYECDICLQRFTQSNSLKAHRLIHDGAKPVYHCELCPSSCGRKTDLKIHVQKLHMSADPIPCKKCDETFPDRYTYKQHVKMHHAEKQVAMETDQPQEKQILDENADQPPELEKCVDDNWEKPVFSCPDCSLTFRQRSLLKRHSLRVHSAHSASLVLRNSKPLYCQICQKRFLFVNSLAKHLKKHENLDLRRRRQAEVVRKAVRAHLKRVSDNVEITPEELFDPKEDITCVASTASSSDGVQPKGVKRMHKKFSSDKKKDTVQSRIRKNSKKIKQCLNPCPTQRPINASEIAAEHNFSLPSTSYSVSFEPIHLNLDDFAVTVSSTRSDTASTRNDGRSVNVPKSQPILNNSGLNKNPVSVTGVKKTGPLLSISSPVPSYSPAVAEPTTPVRRGRQNSVNFTPDASLEPLVISDDVIVNVNCPPIAASADPMTSFSSNKNVSGFKGCHVTRNNSNTDDVTILNDEEMFDLTAEERLEIVTTVSIATDSNNID